MWDYWKEDLLTMFCYFAPVIRHSVQTMCSMSSRKDFGKISVQVPTSLCMRFELLIYAAHCFFKQCLFPKVLNIYINMLYLRYE